MNLIDLYRAIRTNAKHRVSTFRADWKTDRNILRKMYSAFNKKEVSEIAFVHVAKSTGTYLFPIYSDNLDVVRPYLFGHCTRRKTLTDVADIFSDSSITITGDEIIQHFDGRKLRVISSKDAMQLFIRASQVTRRP